MGLLDFPYAADRTAERQKYNRLAQIFTDRQGSVMSQPQGEPWRPDHERIGGHALQAPMISPDDLVGTGIPSKLAGLLMAGAKGAVGKGLLGGAVAQTAWHGSPHKFDKFSLDAIGTGEGAQAYGHGLYLAEAPEVAKEYQRALGRPDSAGLTKAQDVAAWAHSTGVNGNDAVNVLKDEIARLDSYGKFDGKKLNRNTYMEALAMVQQNAAPTNGNLYKTDIPDEAVAKFLDWDKPLSQQAPEVQAALVNSSAKYGPVRGNASIYSEAAAPYMRGQDFYRDLENALSDGGIRRGSTALSGQGEIANAHLQELGIHGIRYLDGGSRGAGQGSSNFVAFNPDLIRILERNGQPTGLQPWQPGEWHGLLRP